MWYIIYISYCSYLWGMNRMADISQTALSIHFRGWFWNVLTWISLWFVVIDALPVPADPDAIQKCINNNKDVKTLKSFSINDFLWVESTSHWWLPSHRPVMRGFVNKLLNKCRWFETPWLWRHCHTSLLRGLFCYLNLWGNYLFQVLRHYLLTRWHRYTGTIVSIVGRDSYCPR